MLKEIWRGGIKFKIYTISLKVDSEATSRKGIGGGGIFQ